MKKILNNHGFSLIEVIVAMGLMGAFVMGFMRLSDKIIESEKKMMDLMEMNDLVARIRYTLNDTVACNKTFSVDKVDGTNDYKLPLKLEKIVDRRDKVIVEKNQRIGRLTLKGIRISLETIEGEHIVEEPRFVSVLLHITGTSRLMKNKMFKISVPVLLDYFEDKTFKFSYCDSLTSGVAQEMTNQIMRKMCESFNVPYDEHTGQCQFEQIQMDSSILKSDMFKQIQEMLKKK